jgi:hypothetical protein
MLGTPIKFDLHKFDLFEVASSAWAHCKFFMLTFFGVGHIGELCVLHRDINQRLVFIPAVPYYASFLKSFVEGS